MKNEIIFRTKKQIIQFDESGFCGELAYGYSDKKEAIKAIEKYTGEKIECPEDMQKIRVLKFKDKDGEDFYSWADKCKECGRKNNGVWCWADFA